MIYIFQGLQAVCTAPANLCKLCGELLGQCHCEPCRECCNEASHALSKFMGRPLSTYVVLAVLISLLEIYFCFQPEACDFPTQKRPPVTLSAWCMIQACFAILNLAFAPYMQHQVWKAIMAEVDAKPSQIDPKTKKQMVPKSEVQNAFKTVFMLDFGVLVYFIMVCISFFWSTKGAQWAYGSTPRCFAPVEWAAWLGRLLFGVAATYTFCWYCCPCCAKAIMLEQQTDEYYERRPGLCEASGD